MGEKNVQRQCNQTCKFFLDLKVSKNFPQPQFKIYRDIPTPELTANIVQLTTSLRANSNCLLGTS